MKMENVDMTNWAFCHRIAVKDILAIAGDPSDPIKLHCIGHENLTLQIMPVHCTVHHLALCAASWKYWQSFFSR